MYINKDKANVTPNVTPTKRRQSFICGIRCLSASLGVLCLVSDEQLGFSSHERKWSPCPLCPLLFVCVCVFDRFVTFGVFMSLKCLISSSKVSVCLVPASCFDTSCSSLYNICIYNKLVLISVLLKHQTDVSLHRQAVRLRTAVRTLRWQDSEIHPVNKDICPVSCCLSWSMENTNDCSEAARQRLRER